MPCFSPAAVRLQHCPSTLYIQPPWQLFKAESTRGYALVIIGPSRRASGGKMLGCSITPIQNLNVVTATCNACSFYSITHATTVLLRILPVSKSA
ncbi:hypothetical protein COCMIDRAFT_34744 [Bipolaris oryzae ATCC 44560]|uniref:Uncharacterized protein n=1 Tax=Bipolaris oryzae ATCC 44560 TaxID=930090 RepID=W6ZVN2_COCMI|nr:uncharacterized protein COCMIDRAFT_34744 [Bipolaris oryzae ATCC 44560]EUC47836.1 hypothetical protein COCMIDRAFT_34744 [Bipolaris oryzae ATCC 44560]